jgi:phage gp37-like protein
MIGLVENAMLARIKAATQVEAVPYAYRTLETWPARFDHYLESQVVQYPAAWTAFGGAHKVERLARGRWRAHCVFGLVVAAKNLRNEESQRHGGSDAEPGSYQLAVDAVRLLSGQSLGLDIDALEPTSILPLDVSDLPKLSQTSLYAVSFDTGLYFDTAPSVGDLNDFVTFHADWDPAPYGSVDRDDLPAPEGPGRVFDTVTLKQDS